ncbi:MAG: DnaJ domain-containing protein [SAR324 cluster bacterium]|nr:DnaJ domain-containing protein [SAR324 cluster bacterium]
MINIFSKFQKKAELTATERLASPYLRTLGLDRSASKIDVKMAYRRLAFIHHPDMGGTPEQFVKIQNAYEQASKFI